MVLYKTANNEGIEQSNYIIEIIYVMPYTVIYHRVNKVLMKKTAPHNTSHHNTA